VCYFVSAAQKHVFLPLGQLPNIQQYKQQKINKTLDTINKGGNLNSKKQILASDISGLKFFKNCKTRVAPTWYAFYKKCD
jgi:hypothetical protein